MHKQFKSACEALAHSNNSRLVPVMMVSGLALADTEDFTPVGKTDLKLSNLANSTAYFSIGETSGDGDCDDTDEHCTVKGYKTN